MADRTPEERAAARRERELRRAERDGREPVFDQAAQDFLERPPEAGRPADPEPAAAVPPEPEPEPAPPEPAPAPPEPAAPAPAAPVAPAPEPVALTPIEPEPEGVARAIHPEGGSDTTPPSGTPERTAAPTPVFEESAQEFLEQPPLVSRREPARAPAPASPEPELVGRRQAPAAARPLKSFPSPPDPEFYAADDELEAPAGTRRVSRAARRGAPDGSGRPPRPPRGRRREPTLGRPPRRRRWIGRVLALIALLVVAAAVVFAIEVFQPFGTSPHGRVTVRIPQHTSSTTVAKQLKRQGVISSSFFFELRTGLSGDRGKIRAGTYHLREGMSYSSVLTALTRVPKAAPTTQLTIAEGHTRRYVAGLLRRQRIKGDYLAATRRSTLLDPRRYGAPRSTSSLEGFLFPDTYTLTDPPRISALVADQLRDFKRRFATLDLAAARRRHLTPYQVLIVASLIEGEAASARDRPLVASVIYNRLRDHMMLQLDSTTRFATGNLTAPLTQSQLDSGSPYNTRNHYGLPPGPIDSPGIAALRAAAHPASSNYLYFFTKPCTNRAVYATNYGQFQNLLIRDKRTHCG